MPAQEITLSYLQELRRSIREGIINVLATRRPTPVVINGICFPILRRGEVAPNIARFLANLDQIIDYHEAKGTDPQDVLAEIPDAREHGTDIWVLPEPR